jgi:benzoylformate decarboxylase
MTSVDSEERTGTDVLLEVLRSEGVRHIFGNPGSTELGLIDALAAADDISYVLGLHEQTVIGMADGYAQVTGRPAFVNVHSLAGVGNAMGGLVNAAAHQAALVVTAGNQDIRHLIADPLLGGDLPSMAASTVKWAHEVRSPGELGTVLRRAFKDAAGPPAGPVFVSLRSSTLDETPAPAAPAPSRICYRAAAESIDELAVLLTEPEIGRLAIVAGDEVALSGAGGMLLALAETLGAPVFAAPLYSKGVFPPGHALYAGVLPPAVSVTRRMLTGFDRVLYLGGQVFTAYPFTRGSALPDGTDLIQISADPLQVGRTYPVRLGLCADVRSTLTGLLPAVRDLTDAAAAKEALEAARANRTRELERLEATAREAYGSTPVQPVAAVHAALRATPPHTIVVDESSTANEHVRDLHQWSQPGRFYCNRGGGLGWGMAAPIGVSLAHRREAAVLAVVGDGALMYAPQALWSAAHEQTPVVYLVLDNRQYLILKNNLRFRRGPSVDLHRFVGMELTDPEIDLVALAESMGVPAVRSTSAAGTAEAVTAAYESGGPRIVVVPVAG